jgi:hypothetical protein
MATTLSRTAIEVEKTLTGFLRTIDFADRLWARSDHGHISFWLLTKPVSHEKEREVYEVQTRINRYVPDARYSFFVINPEMYEEPFAFVPPLGATEIRFHN